MPRRAFVLALLAAPSMAGSLPSWFHLEARAENAGALLGRSLAVLGPRAPVEGELPEEGEPEETPPEFVLAAVPSGSGSASKPQKGRTLAKKVVGSVFVGERTVLRLANAGHVPAGTPVKAKAGRPAGIALTGVAELGIGMAEGDVLVEVEGSPVRTEGDVVGRVIVARARQVPRMTAKFFRGKALWALVVEMPYLNGRPTSSP